MKLSLTEVLRYAVPAAVLAADSVKDVRTRRIYPFLTAAAAVSGGIWSLKASGFSTVLFGIIPGLLVIGYSVLSGGKVGAGDGIAVCMTGAWLGFAVSLAGLFSGLFLAVSAETAVYIIGKKGNGKTVKAAGRSGSRTVPFLPYLLAGVVLSVLCMTEWV